MPSKHFADILQQMQEIHDKKSHDYATNDDPFSNFKRAAVIASWFTNDVDKVFASLLGIKLARLSELLSTEKEPLNESIDDSFVDCANYTALWASWRRSIKEELKTATNFKQCSKCNFLGINQEHIISHCLNEHKAEYFLSSKTIKFKDGSIHLIP